MSEDNGNDRMDKFLGLTKVQFLGVAVGFFAILTGIALVFLGAQIGKNGQLARQAADASEQNLALIQRVQSQASQLQILSTQLKRTQCAQKEQAQKQVVRTADFLAENPGSIQIGNSTFSREDLIRQLNEERAFRDTFNDIDCSETK